MRRKKNIIDDIALRMRFEEITDDEIITLISENVQDLEMGDREGATLLWHAAFLNRRKVAEWLIGHGANINTQDEIGFSALHIATQEKHIELVSYLLQNGANVNIQDKFGNTPLMRTDRATPDEIFRILLENGADVDLKNIAGVSFRDICFGNVSPYVQGLIDEKPQRELDGA